MSDKKRIRPGENGSGLLLRGSLLLCISMLSACAGLQMPGAANRPGHRPVVTMPPSVTGAGAVSDEAPPEGEDSDRAEASVSMPGSGQFLNTRAGNRREPIPEDGEIALNFEGNDIQEVVKTILGDLLQQNYVIGPGISGKVTFSTARPLKKNQLMGILEMLLGWNKAALVYKDGRYNVLPRADAVPGNLSPRTDNIARARGYEVRAVPLHYIGAAEMQKILEPFARDGAILRVDPARNMLILAGTGEELRNYLQTVDTFDVDWLKGMSVGMFPVQRVEAKDVVDELKELFGPEKDSPMAGMFRFVAMERLNSVMVITPQADYLKKAEDWIYKLDRGGSEAGTRLYVYYVENVKATDLADTLNEVFGGRRSSSRRNTGNVAPGLEPIQIRGINNPRNRSDAQRRQRNQVNAARRSGGAATDDMQITAVEENNALLVRATPAGYDAVLSAIKRLDIIPLQVLIEARIIEVTLSDNLKYGVQWFFENAIAGSGAGGVDSLTFTGPSRGLFNPTESALTFGTGGFNYSFAGRGGAAIINALAENTHLSTVSAPSMMVLNNKEATINVGTQIPVNSTFIDTGNNTNQVRGSVQFRDTGTTLSVTPRVNPGGLVFMEIDQTVSVPIEGSDSNGNVSVNQRQFTTEVAVQSGETIVLGGLIQTTTNQTENGVPILKDIPILGNLFRSTTDNTGRTELLVLITPTVVQSQQQARSVSEEYRRKFKGLKKLDVQY